MDTTGAGDTFTGYFIAGLYRDDDITVILKEASVAAAIAISKEGAASSIPEYEDVKKTLENNR